MLMSYNFLYNKLNYFILLDKVTLKLNYFVR